MDKELIESPNACDKSYWENIYHYLDSSPKPDPATLTLGQILSESAINVLGFQFENLHKITSFFYDDSFQVISWDFY